MLTADNVRNEVDTSTIRRSQEVLKMLSAYTHISFVINCFVKNTGTTILLTLRATRHQLSLYGAGLHGLCADSVNSSSDYFAYLHILKRSTS
jgi:hypothetical protein